MQLLLGGLITLSVTAIVQIIIIPWVQRRNRTAERWEKDLLEFSILLNEELKGSLPRAAWADDKYLDLRTNPPGDNLEQYERDLAAAEADLEEAYAETAKHVGISSRLERRLWAVAPRAPYWEDIGTQVATFHGNVLSLDPKTRERRGHSPSRRGELWEEAFSSCLGAATLVDNIAYTMRPPPVWFLEQRAWLYDQVRRPARSLAYRRRVKHHRERVAAAEEAANGAGEIPPARPAST